MHLNHTLSPMPPTSLSRASTIGWIGLGAMGHHMATNLFIKTSLAYHKSPSLPDPPDFLICEQDDARAESFLDSIRHKGGSELRSRITRVASGKEMASEASRILTMLPSTPQVEAVYLDPKHGILAGIPSTAPALHPESSHPETSSQAFDSGEDDTIPGLPKSDGSHTSLPSGPHTLLIDGTTLDPTAAVAIAEKVHNATNGGAVMLDAPVSGGIVAADAATLTIMFGSPSLAASALAIPLLQRMARDGGVIACGGNGTGVGVKVCNNLVLAINQIGLAEGLALGDSLGIDPVLLHNVINSSSGQSWSSRINSPLPQVPNSPGSRGYAGGFQSRLMLKDVGLALSAAHKKDLPTPLGWAARSVYDAVCEEGDGEWATKDFSVVLEWLRKKQDQGVERGWKDHRPEDWK